MKAEDSTQKKILDEISATLREGGKTYELIPKIREALSKDPYHQSQLQALKKEVDALYGDAMAHPRSAEGGWNAAIEKVLNLITNLEE